MRALLASAVALCLFSPAAFAQTKQPSPKVEFGQVSNNAVLSGDIIGLTAYNGNKDSVGEIKDLVIDNSKLVGYVISVGGFLGMGEHYVEVQPQSVAITYDQTDKKWKAMINANKEELKKAPEFKYNDRLKH
jgi:opacity protein-like surface antigen